jgi:hypothetical protein
VTVEVGVGSTSASTATSEASAASESVSEAYAEGGAGGNASITNNVSLFGGSADGGVDQQSAGGNSLVTINEAAQPDDIKIRNVPNVYSPSVYPTVSCFRGASAGIGVAGGGLSIGGGKIDKDCVKREYIRLAYSMGAIDRAIYMWCQQPSVWEDFGSVDECLSFEVSASVDIETMQQQLEAFVTEPELREADERIIKTVEAEITTAVAEVKQQISGLSQQVNKAEAEAREREQEREQWWQRSTCRNRSDGLLGRTTYRSCTSGDSCRYCRGGRVVCRRCVDQGHCGRRGGKH